MHLAVISGHITRVILWKVLLPVAFLTFLLSVENYVESHSDVRLDYICTETDSVPERESNVPVIMMHAILDTKETWIGIYEEISAITKRKVCIYDARNHGDSSWNETFTIDATVEDLGSFMDRMNIDRAVLIGHSWGGLTAMKFALSNPSKVEGLFVEDTGPHVTAVVEQAVGYVIRVLQRSLSAIPDGADEATAKTMILKHIRRYLGREAFPGFKKHMPIRVRKGVWEWKTYLKALDKALDNVSSIYTKMEGKYVGKALFIYSTTSFFRVGDQIEVIRKLFPNAKFVPVETNDHFVHFVYPEYTKVLVDFLK